MYQKILDKLNWNRYYKYVRMEVKEKKGSERKFLCPFHDESTPSYFLNKERGIGHCFGCDVSHNLVSLIVERRNVQDTEDKSRYEIAFEKLLELAGLEEDSLTPEEIKEKIRLLNEFDGQKKKSKRHPQIDQMPKTVDLSIKARKYLHDRFITDKVIENRGIKFCDYGYFKDRLIVPLFDKNGKYRTFEARLVRKPRDKEERKVLYPKKEDANSIIIDDIIYNYDRCKDYSEVIGTEGIMDCLSLESRGIKNTVSFLGVNLTEERKKMLSVFDSLIVLLDYDKAGIQASLKIKEEMESFLKVSVCKTFSNKDVKHMDIIKIKIAIQNSKIRSNYQINFLKKKIESIQGG